MSLSSVTRTFLGSTLKYPPKKFSSQRINCLLCLLFPIATLQGRQSKWPNSQRKPSECSVLRCLCQVPAMLFVPRVGKNLQGMSTYCLALFFARNNLFGWQVEYLNNHQSLERNSAGMELVKLAGNSAGSTTDESELLLLSYRWHRYNFDLFYEISYITVTIHSKYTCFLNNNNNNNNNNV